MVFLTDLFFYLFLFTVHPRLCEFDWYIILINVDAGNGEGDSISAVNVGDGEGDSTSVGSSVNVGNDEN